MTSEGQSVCVCERGCEMGSEGQACVCVWLSLPFVCVSECVFGVCV